MISLVVHSFDFYDCSLSEARLKTCFFRKKVLGFFSGFYVFEVFTARQHSLLRRALYNS